MDLIGKRYCRNKEKKEGKQRNSDKKRSIGSVLMGSIFAICIHNIGTIHADASTIIHQTSQSIRIVLMGGRFVMKRYRSVPIAERML